MSIKTLNKKARKSQRGYWSGSISLLVLGLCLPVSLGIINGLAQLLFERPQVSGVLFATWEHLPGIISASLAAALLFTSALLICSLKMGEFAWYYGGSKRQTRNSKWVTFWCKPTQMIHAFGLVTSVFLRKIMWLLALILPAAVLGGGTFYISANSGLDPRLLMVLLGGAALLLICGVYAWLWVIQRYTLVYWIAVCYPTKSTKKTIAMSIEKMEECHGFSLWLSMRCLFFAPLAIFALPLLWIIPYVKQRRALWAYEIIEGNREDKNVPL
ncbi:MAG: hypothetical protein FWG82_05485 [Oscillospiraceae bacterium]|nr:hypothetical protein [Oscillospiraceae bacterium]